MRAGLSELWRPGMCGRPGRLRRPGATQKPRGPHGPPGGEAGAAQAEGRLPPLQGLGAQGEPARGVQGRPGGGRGPLLDAWLHDAAYCRIPEVVRVEKKVRRRRDDVLAAVGLGIGNGRVESSNDKVKVAVGMGYGFRNVDNLISLLMLRCSDIKPALPGRRAA